MYDKIMLRLLALKNSVSREEGQDFSEYGLLIAFIAIVVVVGIGLFGGALNDWFNSLATWVGSAWAPPGP